MVSLKILRGAELAPGVRDEVHWPAGTSRFVIGRDPAAHWAIPDSTLALSARHCELVATPRGVVLRDLSTNGTFVNDDVERLHADRLLQHGDRITLGPYQVRLALVESTVRVGQRPAASPAPAKTTPLAMPAAAKPPAPTPRAAEADAGDVGLTRMAQSPRAARKPRAAPAAAASVPAGTVPAPRAADLPAASAQALREALAEGLGLPASVLAGRDALQLTLRVAALAQAAVGGLHHLLAQQARVRNRIGARPPAVLDGEPNPLRLAGESAQAMYALLTHADPGAAVAQACSDLLQHQERLLDAVDTAADRMGRTLAPQAFERAIGSASTADAARCWALYLEIWQRMGLPAGQPWAEGFAEALARHLALAYETPTRG